MSSPLLPVPISARCVFILGLVAGYVDALSFVDLGGVFAGAMTGNTTHMGASLIDGNWRQGLLLTAVLGLFFLAAILSSLVRLLWLPARGVMIMTLLMALAQIVHGSPLRYWGADSTDTSRRSGGDDREVFRHAHAHDRRDNKHAESRVGDRRMGGVTHCASNDQPSRCGQHPTAATFMDCFSGGRHGGHGRLGATWSFSLFMARSFSGLSLLEYSDNGTCWAG